jgi:hypothetical protein
MTIVQCIRQALLPVIVAFGMVTTALAQDFETRVIVPDAPGGAKFSGCYRANEQLYGPYNFSFCLEQRGGYRVRGGGVTCEGKLNWWVTNKRDIHVKIDRARCGNGVAWAEAKMRCRGTTLLKGPVGKAISKVIVPDYPTITGLRCTYNPSVKGERSRDFNARRVS